VHKLIIGAGTLLLLGYGASQNKRTPKQTLALGDPLVKFVANTSFTDFDAVPTLLKVIEQDDPLLFSNKFILSANNNAIDIRRPENIGSRPLSIFAYPEVELLFDLLPSRKADLDQIFKEMNAANIVDPAVFFSGVVLIVSWISHVCEVILNKDMPTPTVVVVA